MEPKEYEVTKIEGEYAYLRDMECGEELFITLALLPVGTDIGSKLRCEMMSYTLID